MLDSGLVIGKVARAVGCDRRKLRNWLEGRGLLCKYVGSITCMEGGCVWCFEKSFASCGVAAGWARGWDPRGDMKYCNGKRPFLCGACGHTYEAVVANVARGSGCPYCAAKCLCRDGDCAVCAERSFVSKLDVVGGAMGWDPRRVARGSGVPRDFACGGCGHVYMVSPAAVGLGGGSGCPYCAGKRLCSDVGCAVCWGRSFASHERAVSVAGWDPRGCLRGSNRKLGFVCGRGHEFAARPVDVVRGSWCPACSRKRVREE